MWYTLRKAGKPFGNGRQIDISGAGWEAVEESKKLASKADAGTYENRLKPTSFFIFPLPLVVWVSCIIGPFIMELNTYLRSRSWRS